MVVLQTKIASCMHIFNSVIYGFKPKIYKLIHYVFYEHLNDLAIVMTWLS